MSTRAYVALGANLGTPWQQLQQAVARLEEDVFDDLRVSSVYESAPWGFADQPRFLNLVVSGVTDWRPSSLLHYFRELEKELGRVPGPRNGPRALDIDLLSYGDEVIEEPELSVPHPRMSDRGFVCLPLQEVAPEWVHPTSGRTIAELCAAIRETEPELPTVLGPLLRDTANR